MPPISCPYLPALLTSCYYIIITYNEKGLTENDSTEKGLTGNDSTEKGLTGKDSTKEGLKRKNSTGKGSTRRNSTGKGSTENDLIVIDNPATVSLIFILIVNIKLKTAESSRVYTCMLAFKQLKDAMQFLACYLIQQ